MCKLTILEDRFLDEYLIDLDAMAAWIRAGSTATPRSAKVSACRVLAKPHVQTALAKRRAELAQRNEVSQDRVVQEYRRVGFARITDYLSFGAEGVTLNESSKLSPEQVAAIESVSQTFTKQGQKVIHFKLHSKLGALDSLCKVLGFNAPEKKELTGKDGAPLFPEDDLAGYTDEELRAMRAIHEAAESRRGKEGAGTPEA